MKNMKRTLSEKIVISFLVVLTILSAFIGILSYSPKTVYAEENSNLTQLDEKTADKNFAFMKDNVTVHNDIFGGVLADITGKTMCIPIKVDDNIDLFHPETVEKTVKIKSCSYWFCDGGISHHVGFDYATLSFTISKYNGTSKGDSILTYYLHCDSNGVWSDSVDNYYTNSLNVRCKSFLSSEDENIFVEKDYGKYIMLLLTADDYDENYYVEFNYYYRWHKYTKHNHHYVYEIKNDGSALSCETNTCYGIFNNYVYSKISDPSLSDEQNKEKIKEYYNEDFLKYFDKKYSSSPFYTLDVFVNNLLEMSEQFSKQTIKVSFLRPIMVENNSDNIDGETTEEKIKTVLPFAYMYTTYVEVPTFRGRIKADDVVTVLEDKEILEENELGDYFKIFNSNFAVGEFLDQSLVTDSKVVTGDSEYRFSYYPTYIVKLKSSSGDEMNISLGLTNMSSYYSEFCVGSNNLYSCLDNDFYWVVYNAILNKYGLSGYQIPDGINGGTSIISPSNLYAYWGFALVPAGGGFDGLLSKFIDGKVQTKGIYYWLSNKVNISAEALASLESDFGYSYFSRVFGKIFNSVGSVADATYYMFFISDIDAKDDFIYVISENGSVDPDDNAGLTEKTVKKGVSTLVKGVKTVFKKVGNIFKDPKKVLIIVGIVFLVIILLWVCLKLFKNL